MEVKMFNTKQKPTFNPVRIFRKKSPNDFWRGAYSDIELKGGKFSK
jgi:hypothetical protein